MGGSMKTPKCQMTIYFSPEMKERIDVIRKKDRRSLTNMLIVLVEKGLEGFELPVQDPRSLAAVVKKMTESERTAANERMAAFERKMESGEKIETY
jgi:predicted DNA-binding protein